MERQKVVSLEYIYTHTPVVQKSCTFLGGGRRRRRRSNRLSSELNRGRHLKESWNERNLPLACDERRGSVLVACSVSDCFVERQNETGKWVEGQKSWPDL